MKPRALVDDSRKIELVALSSLKKWPNNSNKHPPEQISHIAELIKQFGWTRPLLIDEARHILAGEGAWRAGKKLGIREAPVIVLRDLSPEEKRAYVIADNQAAKESYWNVPVLTKEIKALELKGFDLSITGVDLSAIVTESRARGDAELSADKKKMDRPAVRPGDTWLLGEHKLFIGKSPKVKSLAPAHAAIRRWQAFTGEAATLHNDGRTFDELVAERRAQTKRLKPRK